MKKWCYILPFSNHNAHWIFLWDGSVYSPACNALIWMHNLGDTLLDNACHKLNKESFRVPVFGIFSHVKEHANWSITLCITHPLPHKEISVSINDIHWCVQLGCICNQVASLLMKKFTLGRIHITQNLQLRLSIHMMIILI